MAVDPLAFPGGWTWASPQPFGDDVQALWLPGAGRAWAATNLRMLRLADGAWSASAPAFWTSVSGRSETDVWASQRVVGRAATADDPSLLHWDGASWTAVPPPAGIRINRVLAPQGTSDLWAAGVDSAGSGSLLLYSGGIWITAATRVSVNSLFSSADDAVWATLSSTSNGRSSVMRFSAEGTLQLPVSTSSGFVAGWADRVDDIWVYSASLAAFVHWDGERWTSFAPPAPVAWRALWGSGPSDVYAVGGNSVAHWDGRSWSIAAAVQDDGDGNSPAILGSILGTSASDVWAAGNAGHLLHFDGRAWTNLSQAPRPEFLEGLFARAADDAWAVGVEGAALRWDGARWASVDTGVADELSAVWASARDDAWIGTFTAGRTLHWDGARFVKATDPALEGVSLGAFSGTSRSDVWAVSVVDGVPPLHFDGSSWSVSQGPARVWTSIVATSATDVWALPLAGGTDAEPSKLWRFDGQSWTTTDTGSPKPLAAMWANGPADAWAFSSGTTDAYHWDGQRWTPVPLGFDPRGVSLAAWGGGRDDVWVVSFLGWTAHWDGRAFTPYFVSPNLFAISGTADGHVWASGGTHGVLGTLQH